MLNKILLILSLLVLFCYSANLPPKNNGALMARYIVHNSDYASIASVSTTNNVQGYPFVTVKSISDGPPNNGTGNTYMYLSSLDMTSHDVAKNDRVSVSVSLVQSEYCNENNLDPEDPNCARTTLFGRFIKVANNTDEFKFAEKALFQRHPAMPYWPKHHNFYVAKVLFDQIVVLDQFGGPLMVSTEDYFNVKPSELWKYSDQMRSSYFGFRIINVR